MRYIDDNVAIDGLTRLVKSFRAIGQADIEDDTVEATKNAGFVSTDSFVSLYQAEEKGGLEVIQTGGLAFAVVNENEVEYVCVATTERSRLLAFGATWAVTGLSARTETSLNLLDAPIGGSYLIDAQGAGEVEAALLVEYRENTPRVLYDGGCEVTGIPSAGVAGAAEVIFTEAASAQGVFDFRKELAVDFEVEGPAGAPLSPILTLCPFAAPQLTATTLFVR